MITLSKVLCISVLWSVLVCSVSSFHEDLSPLQLQYEDEPVFFYPILQRSSDTYPTGRANESEQLAYVCDFNETSISNDSVICIWNLTAGENPFSKSNWRIGSGTQSYFIGGPKVDSIGDENGNFAFFDVAVSRWKPLESKFGWLVSETFVPTQPNGECLAFQYNLFGLGIESLQVLLMYNVEYGTQFNANTSAQEPDFTTVISYETAVLWEKNDTTNGQWKSGHLSFASQTDYQIIFSAIPSLMLDKYEGYAAIDNTVFTFGPCPGDCSFEADFCNWENVNDDTVQFQWSLGRGTTNTITGPLRDHPSTDTKRPPGGYAYVDSSYPRRSGDKAALLSPTFPAELVEQEPYCLKFWMSAYGPKIGGLSMTIVPVSTNCTNCLPETIWKLRPEKIVGLPDLWILSQATLVSAVDFRVRLDATVGDTGESDLAVDDISFQPGSCSAMPSMASPPGDCTFDDDYCGYTVKSIRQAAYSPPLWEMVHDRRLPGFPLGHTRVPRYKIDSYMRFDTNNFQHAPLDRSWLLSPVLKSNNAITKYCLTFWVNMLALAPTKDGLGALQVLIVDANTTQSPNPNFIATWRLNNHQDPKWVYAQAPFILQNGTQIAFEGIEGLRTLGSIAVDDISIFPIYGNDSICEMTPEKARLRDGDCYFDGDTFCGWQAGSSIQGSATWLLANTWEAPNFINDHTFGAPRSGFAFFNPAGQPAKQQAVLVSPEVKVENGTVGACFSFWFLTTGDDPDATLTVADRTSGALGPSELLRIKAMDYVVDENNPQWHFGQVTVGQGVSTFRVHVYATGTYAIFALDDVTIFPATTPCASRP